MHCIIIQLMYIPLWQWVLAAKSKPAGMYILLCYILAAKQKFSICSGHWLLERLSWRFQMESTHTCHWERGPVITIWLGNLVRVWQCGKVHGNFTFTFPQGDNQTSYLLDHVSPAVLVLTATSLLKPGATLFTSSIHQSKASSSSNYLQNTFEFHRNSFQLSWVFVA